MFTIIRFIYIISGQGRRIRTSDIRQSNCVTDCPCPYHSHVRQVAIWGDIYDLSPIWGAMTTSPCLDVFLFVIISHKISGASSPRDVEK